MIDFSKIFASLLSDVEEGWNYTVAGEEGSGSVGGHGSLGIGKGAVAYVVGAGNGDDGVVRTHRACSGGGIRCGVQV